MPIPNVSKAEFKARVRIKEIGANRWLYLDGKGGETRLKIRAALYDVAKAIEVADNIRTDNPTTWTTKVEVL